MKKILLIVIVSLIYYGCSSSKEKSEERDKVGRYVYIDSQNILHIKKRCLGMRVTDSEGDSYRKPVEFIDTVSVTRKHIKRMCSWCVDDAHYLQLKQIAERNDKSLDWGRND